MVMCFSEIGRIMLGADKLTASEAGKILQIKMKEEAEKKEKEQFRVSSSVISCSSPKRMANMRSLHCS
jgi:hypothetical protein